MDTKKFRTRQETVAHDAPGGEKFIIGLDAGYSSMKVFTQGQHFCFPSYARKISGDVLSIPDGRDILYKDLDTGDVYMVGYSAQNMLSADSTNDTDGEMFSRKRYGSTRFRVLCHTALGLALTGNPGGLEPVIQTGLPTSYLGGDRDLLVKALSTPARFALRSGESAWVPYELDIKKENIYVMAQPAGSLYSVCTQDDGAYTPDVKDILFGNTLVMDIGFGTFDFYGLKNRALSCRESIDEIGMRSVLQRTSRMIMEEYHEDIRVQALQKNLESGFVTCVDEDAMTSEERPVAPILERADGEAFAEAFRQAKAVTNAFRDYGNIIIAGGTGEAWFGRIKDFFSGMKTVRIIPSNRNDGLPFIYSNVRGYYYSLLAALRK